MQNLVCPYQEHDVQKHILLLTLLSYYNQDSGTQDWRKEDEQQPLQNFFFFPLRCISGLEAFLFHSH